jgi:hypothetical protein
VATGDKILNIKQGIYRHFKGNKYHILGVAQHSENGSSLVVYRPMYGAGDLWVRPVEMFLETVELNGQQVPRFELLEQAEQ